MNKIRGALKELIEDGTCAMPTELVKSLDKRLRDIDLNMLKMYIRDQREFAIRDYIASTEKE